MRILSTKILSPKQIGLFKNTRIDLKMYDSIRLDSIDFKTPIELNYSIFTSQNGVEFFLKTARKDKLQIQGLPCFCVGEKTASLLEQNGFQVLHHENYATDLANFLVENHREKSFSFFCGDKRRNTLPEVFQRNQIDFKEILTYKNQPVYRIFTEKFDVILFFSPSGVESFTAKNKIPTNCHSICIGTTTAKEAKKHTSKILISKTTTVESVIEKTIELKNNINPDTGILL